MAVSWVLSIPAFQGLTSRDQQLLLEEALPELLILTALQFKGSASFQSIESQLKQFLSPADSLRLDELIKYVSGLSPPLNHLELTSLKALLLFRPGSYSTRFFPRPEFDLQIFCNRVQWPNRRPSGVHDTGSCSTAFVRANIRFFRFIIESSAIRSTAAFAFNHSPIEQEQQFSSYSLWFIGFALLVTPSPDFMISFMRICNYPEPLIAPLPMHIHTQNHSFHR